MNHTIGINPSISFFNAYEDKILKTRESLFDELDCVSSTFGNEARNMLETKLKSNNRTPLLGELFPWIIQDLIKADSKITHKISIGWLAIYLYALFLDEHIDNPRPLSPKEFITGSLLAKTGLLKISHFTNNTSYEKYIDKSFSFSAKNQHLDISFQKENANIDFKEQYSKGKNYVVLACAGALAAQNNKHAEFIIEFSTNLLLTLQYLDDIADFHEDFTFKNFTVLLSETFKSNPDFSHSIKSYSRHELLKELIESGSLQRVIKKINALLNHSILLINRNKLPNNSASFDFFYTLQSYCTTLDNYLSQNQPNFKFLSKDKKDVILDKVESYISIIAQSS